MTQQNGSNKAANNHFTSIEKKILTTTCIGIELLERY